MKNMVLIMVNECGEEVEVDRYEVGNDLDDDYMALWELSKIEAAERAYPEARRFYFEDRRQWNSMINAMIRGDEYYDPWEDEDYEDDEDYGYEYNMACDNTGFCSGSSCPQYYSCQGA